MLTRTLTLPKRQEAQSDPFALGWRTVSRTSPDGQTYFERIPLTLNDILHPQVGDYRVHNSAHESYCLYFFDAFGGKLYHNPQAVVLHNVRVAWATPEMDPHAPDISVIFQVQQVKNWSTFDEVEEGTKPSLIVEVTSPTTRDVDLKDKLREYALVGVEYYLIVDTKQGKKEQGKRELLGYVLKAGRYEKIAADERGWLWLPPVGLWVGIENNNPYCYDEQGNRVADYAEITAKVADLAERLEEEVEARQKESEAREKAEAKAESETLARQKEAKARQEAEAKAVAEAEARQKAEAQLQEIAAKLERLRANLAANENDNEQSQILISGR